MTSKSGFEDRKSPREKDPFDTFSLLTGDDSLSRKDKSNKGPAAPEAGDPGEGGGVPVGKIVRAAGNLFKNFGGSGNAQGIRNPQLRGDSPLSEPAQVRFSSSMSEEDIQGVSSLVNAILSARAQRQAQSEQEQRAIV